MKIDQSGFSAVEGLLIVIVLGIIGGTGWYVYNSQQEDKPVQQAEVTNSQPKPEEITTKVKDTAKTYTNLEFKFSVQYPDDWEVRTDDRRTLGPIDGYSGDTYLVSVGYVGSQHDFNYLRVIEGNVEEAMARGAYAGIQDTSKVDIVGINKDGHVGKKITTKTPSSGSITYYFIELSPTKTLLYEDNFGNTPTYSQISKEMFDSLSFAD